MVPLCIQHYLANVSKTISDMDLDIRCSVAENKGDPNELAHLVLINDPIRSNFVELVDMYMSTRFGGILTNQERADYEKTVRRLFTKYYNIRCPELQTRIRSYLSKKRPAFPASKAYVNEKALEKIEKKMKGYISTMVLPRVSIEDVCSLYDEDDPSELAEMVLWSPKYRRGFEALLEEYVLHAFPSIVSLSQYADKLKCIDLFQKLYYSSKHPYLKAYLNKTKNLF
jgi:hypothetical protein